MAKKRASKKAKAAKKKKRRVARKKKRAIAKRKRAVTKKRATRKKRSVTKKKTARQRRAAKKRRVAKKKRATKKKRSARKKKRTSVAKPTARTAASGLGGALASINAYRNQLAAQLSDIDNRIQGIDDALAAMGSAAPASANGRRSRVVGPRVGSLKDYISRVLSRGRTMAVKDITAAVRKAGYKTKNKTLDKSVGIALTEMKNVAKVQRGAYRLK